MASGTSSGEWDFFISYTKADRTWAEWIAWLLEEDNYRVLIQAWDFVPGSNWLVGMQAGTRDADRTIAVLSESYLRSVYGSLEWQAALASDPEGRARKLLVVRIEPCKRPGLLAGVVSVDLFGLPEDLARTRLREMVAAATAGRRKPLVPPHFPGSGRVIAPAPSFPGQSASQPRLPRTPTRRPTDAFARRPGASRGPARRYRGLIAFGVVTVALIIAAVVAAIHGSDNPQSQPPAKAPPSGTARSRPTSATGHPTAPPPDTYRSFGDPQSQGAIRVAFSRNGDTIATADDNGNTYVRNTATGTVTATLGPGAGGVNNVAFSPDGQTVATCNGDGSIQLWKAASGMLVSTLADPGSTGVTDVAFSPNGTMIATSDGNGHTYLWNAANGAPIATLTDPNSAAVFSVSFSPNGTIIATSDGNGNTYLWNAASHVLTATLQDPQGGRVYDGAFSPGGGILATADGNGNVYLWDPATASLIATLPAPASISVFGVSFSRDGSTLAVASSNGDVYLWNVARHTLAATLRDPHSQSVDGVAFSPKGHTVAAADLNGSTYLWTVSQ